MRLQETRFIPRLQVDVFDYAADFSNIESWDPGVVSSEMTGVGRVGVGSKFHLVVRFGSSTAPMTYEVTVFERPSHVVLIGTGGRVEAVDDIRFSAEADGTRVDYTADLEFKGLMRYLAPLAKRSIRKMGHSALDGLVAELTP